VTAGNYYMANVCLNTRVCSRRALERDYIRLVLQRTERSDGRTWPPAASRLKTDPIERVPKLAISRDPNEVCRVRRMASLAVTVAPRDAYSRQLSVLQVRHQPISDELFGIHPAESFAGYFNHYNFGTTRRITAIGPAGRRHDKCREPRSWFGREIRESANSKQETIQRPGMSTKTANDKSSTKERILKVAEQLFVRYGFKGVSMRLLTRESKVNLSAVHYHFGSMESVLRTIFNQHIIELNQERHERMDACLVDEQNPLLSVQNLIEAYILPVLRHPASTKAPKGTFARLQAQLSVDPSPEVRRVIDGVYDEIGTRFARMLRRHCSHLSDEEFLWRVNCIYGTIFYTQADTGRTRKIGTLMNMSIDQTDREQGIKMIAGFLAAGMLAPATNVGSKARGKSRTSVR
jgi:AcrR family transcriptional regulator